MELKEVVARLDELAESLETLRLEVATAAGLPTPEATSGIVDGVPQDDEEVDEPDNVLRAVRYLKAFYDAPGWSLTAAQSRAAAVAAGYDPRGTAGFYVGTNASLKVVGKHRVLTEVGGEWYEANIVDYPELTTNSEPPRVW